MTPVPSCADVVVIGSGICGAATAASAAARGMRVLVLDKEPAPAGEASGQAQGVLRLQGRDPVELPLAREALRLWRQTSDDGGEFDLVFGGNLYLAQNEQELAELADLVTQAHEAGLDDVALLDPPTVRGLVPASRGEFAGGMWSPHDGHCDPRGATEHFVRLARRAGADFQYGVKASRILVRGSRVAGVEVGASTAACERLVVAAGVWTPHLLSTIGIRVPLMPVALSEGETSPAPAIFKSAVRAVGFGGRQRADGRIVFSAGLNARVTHGLSFYDVLDAGAWSRRFLANRRNVRLRFDWRAVRTQLRHRSIVGTEVVTAGVPVSPDSSQLLAAHKAMGQVFPDVAATRVERMWAGWLDMSLDGRPIIDGAAGPAGLVVVTGLSGHGLTLGPVLGEIAADLAVAGTTAHPIHPFRLSRFQEEDVPIPQKTL